MVHSSIVIVEAFQIVIVLVVHKSGLVPFLVYKLGLALAETLASLVALLELWAFELDCILVVVVDMLVEGL